MLRLVVINNSRLPAKQRLPVETLYAYVR